MAYQLYNNRCYYMRIYNEQEPSVLHGSWCGVAQQICEKLAFHTMLDVGCSIGLLVSAMRDASVEAYGIDISEFAIGQVADRDRAYVQAQDVFSPLPESFPRHFDLVTCIEVAEHIDEERAAAFIGRLCELGSIVFFSSTPTDVTDPTHCNVQQQEYWCKLFARNGFWRCLEEDFSFLTPQAMCFVSQTKDIVHIVEEYERSIRIHRDMKQQVQTETYFDLGDGYSDANCLRTNQTAGEKCRIRINRSGIRRVRLVPAVWRSCIVKDARLVTAQGVAAPSDTNGLVCRQYIAFSTDTPYLDFDLTGQESPYAEVQAVLLPLEDADNRLFLMELKEELAIAEKAHAVHAQELENARQGNAVLLQQLEDMTQDVQEREKALRAEFDDKKRVQEARVEEMRQQLAERTQYAEALANELVAAHNEIAEYSKLVAVERIAHQDSLSQAQEQADRHHRMFDEISNATWWRITAPGRALTNLLKRCVRKLSSRQDAQVIADIAVRSQPTRPDNAHLFRDTDNPVHAIPSVILDQPCKRINLVTDTIDSSSLLGGVATALIVATAFCNQYGYALRIITRNTPPAPENYQSILRMCGMDMPKTISFYSDSQFDVNNARSFRLELTTEDVFFATSWWSAEAIRKTNLRKRFFYIIQEVESFFYCHGGESALCDRVMRNPDIDFIVNSHYLNDYFAHAEPNIAQHCVYFEPAFPKALYCAQTPRKSERHRFFFYSRPNNPRNMFRFGVNVIDQAIHRGILDTDEWEICFIGQQVPDVTFCNGTKPRAMGQMSWDAYSKFLKQVDLALCLMYTPHPSYPPFDVACSGGVVVTNTYMNKRTFPQCRNVLMGEPDCDSLVETIRSGVALALDTQARWDNYRNSTIPTDWLETLSATMSYMARCTR